MVSLETVYSTYPSLKNVSMQSLGGMRQTHTFVLRTHKITNSQSECLGRTKGRLWAEYSPSLSISGTPLDASSLFANPTNPLTIEIGFGSGEATLEIAQSNPNCNYLAFEVFLNGFVRCLEGAEKLGLNNLVLMRCDATEVITRRIVDHSVAGFNVFFPDPWFKKKHIKRRLLTPEFLAVLAAKLVPGGQLHFASDVPDFAEWVLANVNATPGLTNPYMDSVHGGYAPVTTRPKTHYERLNKAGSDRIYDIVALAK